METPLYSSKQVTDINVQIYSKEDDKYFKEERLAAQIMILNRNQRLNIRDYNQQYNK